MNNIHDKDWAEESWGGFSGIGGDSDWCDVEKGQGEETGEASDSADSGD